MKGGIKKNTLIKFYPGNHHYSSIVNTNQYETESGAGHCGGLLRATASDKREALWTPTLGPLLPRWIEFMLNIWCPLQKTVKKYILLQL